MRYFIALSFFFLGAGSLMAQNATTAQPPNIVLILIDDAGLMDLGVYGGEAATPTIDALAKRGMMFTNYHSSPVCAPSRAMLLTGTDSHLTGVPNIPEFLSAEQQQLPGYQGVLNTKVQTISSRLQEAGYNTYMVGKWHLGHTETSMPHKRGFGRTFMFDASGADNYEAKGYLPIKSTAQWYQDGKPVPLAEDFYSSKTYVDKLIGFMEEETENGKPFFSFLSFQAVHIPVQAPREFVEKYKGVYQEGWLALREKRFEKAKELGLVPQDMVMGDMLPVLRRWENLSEADRQIAANDMAVHAAMLEAMDFHIGRYIEYLKKKGLYDNTVFVITSDNGPEGGDPLSESIVQVWLPWQGYHRDANRLGEKGYYGAIGPEFANATASPFAFFKTYAGEGGLRVPLIMAGKNIPQGRNDAFALVTDIMPTLLEIAHVEVAALKSEVPITGKSLHPLLQGEVTRLYAADEAVGIESAGSGALFKGDWKIVRNAKPYGDLSWRLYNIAMDPGETRDLSKQHPEIFAELIRAYVEYTQKYGVIEMGPQYEAHKVVKAKAVNKLLTAALSGLAGLLALMLAWRGIGKLRKARRSL